MALSRLDLPDPLVPSTTVKVPRSSARSTAVERAHLARRVPVEDVGEALEPERDLSHGSPPSRGTGRATRAPHSGTTSTARTKTAVTSLSASG